MFVMDCPKYSIIPKTHIAICSEQNTNTMNSSMKKTGQILVTGGTGKTGSRIVGRLLSRDIPVRIGSRRAIPKFDWEDPETWDRAIDGVQSVYVAFQPDLAVPGSDAAIRSLIEVAKSFSVRRLVLLSGRGEPEAEACEKLVIASGLEWTVIRANWFYQNFSEGYLAEAIASRNVALPAPDIAEPFVDADDIADIAVAALTDDTHVGQIYEVSGPRLMTFRHAVQEISNALGEPIHYEQIAMDDYVSGLEYGGVPPVYISLLRYLFTVVMDGRNASLADGVQRALKRKPRDFSDYVREVVASAAWGKTAPIADFGNTAKGVGG